MVTPVDSQGLPAQDARGRRRPAEERVLLGIYAHPDDEAARAGGTLAMLAARGVRVHLVYATHGEAGQLGDPPVCSRAELGQRRQQELVWACRALGVEEPLVLDYPDGGLAKLDPEPLILYLTHVIIRWRVTAVLTFGQDGISNHPDHVAVHRIAHAAFWRARQAGVGSEHAAFPEYLYYQVVPRSVARRVELPGVRGVPDEIVTHAIDVSPWLRAKVGALVCHQSQWPAMPFLSWPLARQKAFLETEHFVCAYGPPGTARTRDYFAV